MRKINRINNSTILMIVLSCMALSCGIWSNYRQLWLQSESFTITDISRILSVGLVCSSVIAFLLTFFSSKIKVKNVLILSFVLRTISMIVLLFNTNVFVIKTCILLGIMCEVIFSIAFYPLFSFETKTDQAYQKKAMVEYLSKDIAIVVCGLLIGKYIGKYLFDYNTCLIIATVFSILGLIFLIMYKSMESVSKKPSTLFKQMKEIFSSKINNIYLFNQLLINISYGIVFDLIILFLTTYIGFDVALTSIFIIVCNMLGTVASSIFNKLGKNYSIAKSSLIKFGVRSLGYLAAFAFNERYVFIIAIVLAYITSRILEDKVTGRFLSMIDDNNQLLYANIRYFIVSLGEGIGAFLAGVLLLKSFRVLFLGAAIFTIIQTLIMIYLSKLKSRVN